MNADTAWIHLIGSVCPKIGPICFIPSSQHLLERTFSVIKENAHQKIRKPRGQHDITMLPGSALKPYTSPGGFSWRKLFFNISISIKKFCSKSRNVPKQMILLGNFFLFIRKQSVRTRSGSSSFSRFVSPLISSCGEKRLKWHSAKPLVQQGLEPCEARCT